MAEQRRKDVHVRAGPAGHFRRQAAGNPLVVVTRMTTTRLTEMSSPEAEHWLAVSRANLNAAEAARRDERVRRASERLQFLARPAAPSAGPDGGGAASSSQVMDSPRKRRADRRAAQAPWSDDEGTPTPERDGSSGSRRMRVENSPKFITRMVM